MQLYHHELIDVTNFGANPSYEAPPVVSNESDEEIVARLERRANVLKNLTGAVKRGHIRALMVSGPPGVGKSSGIEEVLSKQSLFNVLAEREPTHHIIKGSISAIGLYCQLYHYSSAGNVLVFDDCDDVFEDLQSLNNLKSALDSGMKRVLSWNKDSKMLAREGIPDQFEFRGSVIFVTNDDFASRKGKKLREHLRALESRCHFIDMAFDKPKVRRPIKHLNHREMLLWIEKKIKDGMLERYHFGDEVNDEIMEYIRENVSYVRNIDLRLAIKLADLRKAFPDTWQDYAAITCLTGA